MKDQPKALILANSMHLAYRAGWQREAAAELRRLSEIEAQRDALLEALQDLCDTLGECGMTEKARAAIAAVEGERAPNAKFNGSQRDD